MVLSAASQVRVSVLALTFCIRLRALAWRNRIFYAATATLDPTSSPWEIDRAIQIYREIDRRRYEWILSARQRAYLQQVDGCIGWHSLRQELDSEASDESEAP